jgi:hypothetical protein
MLILNFLGNINQFEKSFSLICVAKQRVKIISTHNRDGVDYGTFHSTLNTIL